MIPFPKPIEVKFTFIDLFAGIGGFRIALQSLGGKCVFSSEIDEAARKTYELNFGERPSGDIKQFTKSEIDDEKLDSEIPDHDILTAGFPCQPFSLAGVSARVYLGQTHGFRDLDIGNLFFDIVRIAQVKKPKAMILENVKNFKSHDQGKTFGFVKNTLENLGYSFYSQVIDSSFTVPQKRQRFYMICFRDKTIYEFPCLEKGEPIPLRLILENSVPDKFTISNKLWEGHQNRSTINKARGTGFTVNLADLDKPSNTIVSRYYKDGKECLIPQKDRNPRMLTPRECARIQGFPEEFILPNSSAAAYRQFGNSVVVPVIIKIAETVLEKLDLMEHQHEKLQHAGFKTVTALTVWEKCYWYLRYLISSEAKGLAKDIKKIESLYDNLTTTYQLTSLRGDSEKVQLEMLRSIFEQTLCTKVKGNKNGIKAYERLLENLEKLLVAPKDYLIFAIAIKELLIPTNEVVKKVPLNETKKFVIKYAKATLDTKKELGLISLVRDWDDFTGMIAINKERDLIVDLYRSVKDNFGTRLKLFDQSVAEADLDVILTALCQEYERRVG